jgi:polyphosphate kinase 2 (PPK2 family)
MLDEVDLDRKLSEKAYRKELGSQQLRLRRLQFRMYEERRSCLAVFEGWDAAGKGGAIKRITETLEPRGYTVSSFAAPRGEEKTHHYLWRFWRALPRDGHIGIWDRSHYGRVLVERVEGFCAEDEWKRAYREISEFEAQQASAGMVVIKFWLHLSKAEQLRRFKDRERDPFRSYKLTDEDWRNRARWGEYQAAVEDMLEFTSQPVAPWIVVEANDKYWARLKVLKSLATAIEEALD